MQQKKHPLHCWCPFSVHDCADGYRTVLVSKICDSRRLTSITCIAVPCDGTATFRKVAFPIFETARYLSSPASLALRFRRRLEAFYFLQTTKKER